MRRIFLFLLVFIFHACEITSYEEYSMPEYSGLFEWEQLTKDADWCNRVDHASTVFNNKMWLSGGYNGGERKSDSYLEDVWCSSDGLNWNNITSDAPWKGRRGHSMITFDDGHGKAMYIIGGFEVDEQTNYRQYTNDVWKSTNGETWEQIKLRTDPRKDSTISINADWEPRFNHTCVIANDTVYLIGGQAMIQIGKEYDVEAVFSTKYYNDVWKSGDCINWIKVETNNDFGIRSQHGAAVDPNTQRIYIFGGMHGQVFSDPDNDGKPFPNWNSVWYSDNGKDWFTDNTEYWDDLLSYQSRYSQRAAHQMLYYNNYLWILPGKKNTLYNFRFARNDTYPSLYRDEYGVWSVDSDDPKTPSNAFGPRESYTSLVFDGKVWILGGNTASNGPDNDVWCGSF